MPDNNSAQPPVDAVPLADAFKRYTDPQLLERLGQAEERLKAAEAAVPPQPSWLHFRGPCSECGERTEINGRTSNGRPTSRRRRSSAAHSARACAARFKAEMVGRGAWRITEPTVAGTCRLPDQLAGEPVGERLMGQAGRRVLAG